MQTSPEEHTLRYAIKSVVVFLAHQLNATLGIAVLAGVLASFVIALMYLVGHTPHPGLIHRVLTGTPFYPMQIVMALLLGWLLGLFLQHRAMYWVWVLPLTVLLSAIIAHPISTAQMVGTVPKPDQTILSHYFGWGCQTAYPCIDQLTTTLPFYVAVFYSLGAIVAGRLRSRTGGLNRYYWGYLSTGILILAATFEPLVALGFSRDLQIYILKMNGDSWWIPAVVGLFEVVFPASLGAYFIRAAWRIRRETTLLNATGLQTGQV